MSLAVDSEDDGEGLSDGSSELEEDGLLLEDGEEEEEEDDEGVLPQSLSWPSACSHSRR